MSEQTLSATSVDESSPPVSATTPDYPSLATALRLARRELRGGLRGFRIFLACLALGVAAIAGVQSLAGTILESLSAQGQSILGGDISLRLLYRDISEEQRSYLEQSTQRLGHFVEMRAMARDAQQQETALVEFKAVDSAYPLYGELELTPPQPLPQALAQQAGQWGALVDSTVLERLALSIGDELFLGEARYQVRGEILREPDRVGGGGNFGLGPRVMVARASLADTGLEQEGSMIYYHYRLALPPGVELQAYREALVERFPHAGWRVRDFNDAAPRLERMITRLTQFFTLVGLTALLVGGVGVSNAVKAFLDSKLRTIAMLKCVGAPSRTVFQVYLAQLLVLASLGIGIGLLVGAAVPWLVTGLLNELLPFRIEAHLQALPLTMAAVFGLLTTLSFTIWPLARVHDVSAAGLFREALNRHHGWPRWPYVLATVASAGLLALLAVWGSDRPVLAIWFVIGALLAMLLFRLAASLVMWVSARLRRPRHPGLRLAVANLHRPGSLTPNVVLSLGLGLTVLVAITLIEGNMSRQVQENLPEQAPAFFFVDIQRDQSEPFAELLAGLEGTGRLQQVPSLRGRIQAIEGVPAEEALRSNEHEWMILGDRGITYSAEPLPEIEILSGEWWPADYNGPPLVSVHQDFAEAFGVSVGDTITVSVLGRELNAEVANVRFLDWESMQINFLMVFSPEPLRSAPHTFLATLESTPDAEREIQRAIAQRFPGITVVRIREALDQVNEILRNIGIAVRAIAAITLVAGTLVLAGAVAAGHRRRVYDSVILKVLGATRRDVLRAFMLEYGLLGVVTALIATAVGSLAAWSVLTWVMETQWLFLPTAVGLTVVLCTGITMGLGFIGTWRALGQKAAPLLRNE